MAWRLVAWTAVAMVVANVASACTSTSSVRGGDENEGGASGDDAGGTSGGISGAPGGGSTNPPAGGSSGSGATSGNAGDGPQQGGQAGGTETVDGGEGGEGDGPIGTVCVPDQPLCLENRATKCNQEGTGYVAESMECSDTQTCVSGVCADQECAPDERFCSTNAVHQCAPDGLSSEEVELCGNNEYCDASSEACKTGVCAPDQPSCEGNRATTCNASGSGFVAEGMACGATATCDAGVCRPHTCTPNQLFCQGQQVKRCAANGLTSSVEATCTNQTCVVSGGSAACTGICAAGQTRCSGNGVQTCNGSGQWGSVAVCSAAAPHCASGACGAPPSCQSLASNCGAAATENCCHSALVTGGSFSRDNNPMFPAAVSNFRLDKFEITVGRFRKFVDAYVGGWRPASGSGVHAHLNSGNGLVEPPPATGNEPGWDTVWSLPNTTTGLFSTKPEWNTSLACDSMYQTWSPSAGASEREPINCVNWYQAYAFCIWDGGFLPSEAEWNYAAAGGSSQLELPWGPTPPAGSDASVVIYRCYYKDSGGACSVAPVGSAPPGHGRWGQADLAGNVWEWTLDWYGNYSTSCTNCARLISSISGANRVLRGGDFTSQSEIVTYYRGTTAEPSVVSMRFGARCARTP